MAAAATRARCSSASLPGGRLIGLDVDPIELPRTEARLRASGFGPEVFVAYHSNFAGLPKVLAAEGVAGADVVVVDLGVSSMQLDNPDRGFTYKEDGPLDMRMNPTRGESAAQLIDRTSESQLATLLAEHADEPHAPLDRRAPQGARPQTTQAVDRVVRFGVGAAHPALTKPDLKMSVRRTLQALRIAVNDEFAVLDALLRALPHCLSPRRPGRDADVPLRRRPPCEEGVSGGTPRRDLRGDRARGHSFDDGRDASEPPRVIGKAQMGGPWPDGTLPGRCRISADRTWWTCRHPGTWCTAVPVAPADLKDRRYLPDQLIVC